MKQKLTDLVSPLCPNFKWYEVWKSETASRLELDNESEDETIQTNAEQLTENILQPLRDKFGPVKINSWCRLEPLEKVIAWKGFENWCAKEGLQVNDESWDEYFARKSHPPGKAADIEINSISNDQLFAYISENMEYDQCIREFPVKGVAESGWVHVSWDGDSNRKQAFTIGAK
jgi:hypothetical protein